MGFKNHLTAFLDSAGSDARIGPTQICLYVVLLCQWDSQQKVNPFEICRSDLMQITKIRSRDTFSRSMKLLQEAGYIRYIPSYSAWVASMVCMNQSDELVAGLDVKPVGTQDKFRKNNRII